MSKGNARQIPIMPLPQTVSGDDIQEMPLPTFEVMAEMTGCKFAKICISVDGKDIELSAFIHRADLRKVGLI